MASYSVVANDSKTYTVIAEDYTILESGAVSFSDGTASVASFAPGWSVILKAA